LLRVSALSEGDVNTIAAEPARRIAIPTDWSAIVKSDAQKARDMQSRVRSEFQNAFAEQLVCAAFERGNEQSHYLLFRPGDLT
jgi:predicted GNAT superfamily acetyltransferase